MVAAFTLIELMVVVAIIALLISILLPSLARARAQAKLLVCKANIRTLGLGHAFYAQDYNGWFPNPDAWLVARDRQAVPRPADGDGNGTLDVATWRLSSGELWPYVKTTKPYLCPADRRNRGGGATGIQNLFSYAGNGTVVENVVNRRFDGWNWYLQGRVRRADIRAALITLENDLNTIRNPGNGLTKRSTVVFALIELHTRSNAGQGAAFHSGATRLPERHLGKGHLYFFDDHVETLDSKRWNEDPDPRHYQRRFYTGDPPSQPAPQGRSRNR